MLDGAGHFVMEERPSEVTAALEQLMARTIKGATDAAS
jgi:pimeloyl-ACP methyl ester carboxylesterase